MLGGQPGIDRLHAQLEIFAVLGEEVGEVAKAILEDDYEGLRTELVQVAAVAVAFLEEMGLREMPR